MIIRHTKESDLPRIWEIYDYAREFMAETGNPKQWGPTHWPPEELVLKDIRENCSYVCEHEGRVVGTFYYRYGYRVEPAYEKIEDGAWIGSDTYGVVHRIACDRSVKGIGTFCLEWALSRSGHLRIDTHGDNKVMQGLLAKLGFTRCGTVYVREDGMPRIGFECIRAKEPLCRTAEGEPMSRILFGTASNAMISGQNVDGLLDCALENGINAFDTARGYGKAESVIGGWLGRRGNRDKVVILSKCGDVNLLKQVRVNRHVIEKELEESLGKLQTDYIDIYLLHRYDPKTPVSEYIETLNEAKKAGKIRCFGVSNWTHERIQEANDYAASAGLEGFSASSPYFGMARQIRDPWGGGCVSIAGPENEEARAWYAENQMPVIAYSSLARGLFSGKFKSSDREGAERVLDRFAKTAYLSDDNLERLREAERMSEETGLSIPQTALRYVLDSEMNTYAVVTMGSEERIKENSALLG